MSERIFQQRGVFLKISHDQEIIIVLYFIEDVRAFIA